VFLEIKFPCAYHRGLFGNWKLNTDDISNGRLGFCNFIATLIDWEEW